MLPRLALFGLSLPTYRVMFVVARLAQPFDLHRVQLILEAASGLSLLDRPEDVTPLAATGIDPVLVGRLRALDDHRLGLWICGDQLRKGAALNALQIADLWSPRK